MRNGQNELVTINIKRNEKIYNTGWIDDEVKNQVDMYLLFFKKNFFPWLAYVK